MNSPAGLKWHPLESLSARFRANVAALERRDPQLAGRLRNWHAAAPFFIAAAGDDVYLGRSGAAGIEAISDPMPAPSARMLVSKIFPASVVTGPLAVSGLGYGWMWDRLAKLPCRVDAAPGHRPPLYFLAGDVDQLWAVLHVLDWREFLADRRFEIFAGPDAFEQLQQVLIEEPMRPEPRALIRIDSSLPKLDLSVLLNAIHSARGAELNEMSARLGAIYGGRSDADWAERFASGRLRVLGITSRYTTFLQHSMRDWLAGLERLGHDVRLFIEPEDHQLPGAFNYTKAVLETQPDLIVIIDHYRAEIGKLPESIPCVMWVQDRLPNIYCAAAGAAQGPRDYCLGFGRLHLGSRYGYPFDRFLSCPVGINEHRFERTTLSAIDCARFGCDVSYVSHASTPADQVLKDHLNRCGSPELSRLFDDTYQRLEAWYAGGGVALSEVALRQMLMRSMAGTGVLLTEAKLAEAVVFFNQNVQNALFRHQTLLWLADAGVNMHLWGNGWEKHPKLGRFARGVADNAADLRKIYLASKINIQVTPHGSVHQRLLDGLAAGGFFLLRWHPGDAVGRVYRDLLDWCSARNIRSDAELYARADDRVRWMIERINELETSTPQNRQMSVFDVMNGHADMNFTGTADTVWPEYDCVAFNTRDELEAKVRHFLGAQDERRQLAASMRQAMLERCSYTRISKRLLTMIANDLQQGVQKCAA